MIDSINLSKGVDIMETNNKSLYEQLKDQLDIIDELESHLTKSEYKLELRKLKRVFKVNKKNFKTNKKKDSVLASIYLDIIKNKHDYAISNNIEEKDIKYMIDYYNKNVNKFNYIPADKRDTVKMSPYMDMYIFELNPIYYELHEQMGISLETELEFYKKEISS